MSLLSTLTLFTIFTTLLMHFLVDVSAKDITTTTTIDIDEVDLQIEITCSRVIIMAAKRFYRSFKDVQFREKIKQAIQRAKKALAQFLKTSTETDWELLVEAIDLLHEFPLQLDASLERLEKGDQLRDALAELMWKDIRHLDESTILQINSLDQQWRTIKVAVFGRVKRERTKWSSTAEERHRMDKLIGQMRDLLSQHLFRVKFRPDGDEESSSPDPGNQLVEEYPPTQAESLQLNIILVGIAVLLVTSACTFICLWLTMMPTSEKLSTKCSKMSEDEKLMSASRISKRKSRSKSMKKKVDGREQADPDMMMPSQWETAEAE